MTKNTFNVSGKEVCVALNRFIISPNYSNVTFRWLVNRALCITYIQWKKLKGINLNLKYMGKTFPWTFQSFHCLETMVGFDQTSRSSVDQIRWESTWIPTWLLPRLFMMEFIPKTTEEICWTRSPRATWELQRIFPQSPGLVLSSVQ